MKRLIRFVSYAFLLAFLCSFLPMTVSNYDDYVDVSSVPYNNGYYNVIVMNRKEQKVKAKYFASANGSGSVGRRYDDWKKDKQVICVSSAGYMDQSNVPVGMTVDNGVLVNQTLNAYDGLVIVYPSVGGGGIVVTNLDDGNLTLDGGGVPPGKKFDIRNSSYDRTVFLDWAKSQNATVFQTHLLIYGDELKIKPPSSINQNSFSVRERRYLAVGKIGDQVYHVIVHSPAQATLYEGTRDVKAFLNNYKRMKVTFMINLDTGSQDCFYLYDGNQKIDKTIQGTQTTAIAANLLAYYLE